MGGANKGDVRREREKSFSNGHRSIDRNVKREGGREGRDDR